MGPDSYFSRPADDEIKLPQGVTLEPANPNQAYLEEVDHSYERRAKRRTWFWAALSGLLAFALLGVVSMVIIKSEPLKNDQSNTPQYSATDVPLKDVSERTKAQLGQIAQLDVNGRLKVNGALVLNPEEQPQNAETGGIYYDKTSNKVVYYNGSDYRTLTNDKEVVASINGQTGAIRLGTGLTLANGILTNTISPQLGTKVESIQGQTGSVSFVSGQGISITGTTITNTGVTTIGSITGDVAIGDGLQVTGNTLSNNGVTQLGSLTGNVAIGDGLKVTGNTLAVGISSSSPDLVVGKNPDGTYVLNLPNNGAGGTVKLGPNNPQDDPSNTPSIAINKTGSGQFLHFQLSGTDVFAVSQSGAITQGTIDYAQVTGAPLSIVTGIDGTAGSIALGTGLVMSGNVLSVNIAGPTGSYITDGTGLQSANFNIASKNAGFVTAKISGVTNQSVDIFQVYTDGSATPVLRVDKDGIPVFQPTADSLNSFRIYNSDATKTLLSADSFNGRIGIGTAAPGYSLDVIGDINASNSILVNGNPVCTTAGCLTQAQAGNFIANTYQIDTLRPENIALLSGFDNQATATLQASVTQSSNLLQLQDSNGNKTLALSKSGSIDFVDTTNTFKSSLSFATPTSNTTFILPSAGGGGTGTEYICTNLNGECTGSGTGITGTGTAGQLAYFNTGTTLGGSLISQNSNTISISGDLTVSNASGITIGVPGLGGTTGKLTFANSANANLVTLQPNATSPTGAIDLRLPSPASAGTYTLAVGVVTGGALNYDPVTGLIDCPGCLTTGGGGGTSGVASVNSQTGSVTIANATASSGTVTLNDASTTQKGIAKFDGNFTTVAGVVSTVQGITTGSSPQFTSLALTAGGTTAASSSIQLGTSSSKDGSVTFRNATNTNTVTLLASSSGPVAATLTLPALNGKTLLADVDATTGLSATAGTVKIGTVPVANGGTGNTTFTTYGLLYGNGTGAVGSTASSATPGQCLVSTAVAPTWANCTNGGGSGGSLTFSDIYTNSTPASFVLNSTNGGLLIKDNSVALGTNLFSIQNNGATTTYLGVTAAKTTIGNTLNLGAGTAGFVKIAANGDVSRSGSVALNTSDVSGTLPYANGGTGSIAASYSTNGVVYAGATGFASTGAAASAGKCLVSTASTPTWANCTAGGGTGGALTFADIYGNSSPASFTLNASNGGLLVQDAGVGIGTNLFAVQSNAGATSYLAVTAAKTTIGNTLNLGAGTAGFVKIAANGDVSRSGSVALNTSDVSGTLPVTNGGTSFSSYTTGDILYASGPSALSKLGVSTNGYCLKLSGGLPSWASCTGSGAGVSLQNAYDASLASPTPEILLDSTRAGFTIQDNASPLGVPLLEVKNSAGTSSYLSVAASGTTVTNAVTLSAATNPLKISAFSTIGVLQNDASGNVTSGKVALNGGSFVTGTLPYGNGGTGSSGGYTTNGVLYAGATGYSSTGLPASNGMCLIGNTASAPTWGTCAGGAGFGATLQTAYDSYGASPAQLTLDSTRKGIIVSDSSPALTATDPLLSVTNNLGTVKYLSVTNSGTTIAALKVSNLNAVGVVQTDASGNLTTSALNLSTATLTQGQLLTSRGGTGIDGSAAAQGKLLLGNGTGYQLGDIVDAGSGRITVTTTTAGKIILDAPNAGSCTNCVNDQLSNLNIAGTQVSVGLTPASNGSIDLGTSVKAWNNAYLYNSLTFKDGATGNRIIAVATQTTANTGGNALNISSGTGLGTGTGGSLALQAGSSGSGATGDGGIITITGGTAASTSGSGGGVTIVAGTSTGTNNGATLALTGGTSGAGIMGNGGNVNITGGAAGSTNGNGGNVTIDSGAKSGTGTGGTINLGTTNASGINLNQSTTLALSKTLTMSGSGGYTISKPAFTALTSFSGTIVPNMSDDSNSPAISLPFTFTYFGVTYNSIFVGSNGYITFTVPPSATTASTIPSTGFAAATIAGAWTDLNTTGSDITYGTIGTAPNRTFIVYFNNVSGYNSGSVAFQIKLNETTNVVEIDTGTNTANTGTTQGIQNATGTQGVAFSTRGTNYNSVFSNDVVTFTPGSNVTFSQAVGNGMFSIQNGANSLLNVNTNGDVLLKGVSSTGTAFQVQNVANISVFSVDTVNQQAVLGSPGSSYGRLLFSNAINNNTVQVTAGAVSASYILTLPTAVGATGDCLKTSNSTGTLTFGSCSANLQTGYTISSGGTTPEIIVDTTRRGVDIQDATAGSLGTTEGLFNVRGVATATTLGASLFTVQGNGRVGINNGSTSTTPAVNYDLSFGQITGVTTARTIGVEAQGTSNIGGNGLTVSSGTGNGTGNGGQLTLQAGLGGAANNSVGGSINILAGGTSATIGSGGNVTIQSGDAALSGGAGGTVSILAGQAGTGGAAGTVSIKGGQALNAGAGGNVTILGGNSPLGNGGNVVLSGGYQGATPGLVIIRPQAGADGSGFFQLQNAAGTSRLLTADSTLGTVATRQYTDTASLGPELITITDFSNGTWSKGGGWSGAGITYAQASGTSNSLQYFGVLPSAGAYQVTFTIQSYSSGSLTALISSSDGVNYSANGTFTTVLSANGGNYLTFTGSAFNGQITSVSMKLITKMSTSLAVQNSGGTSALEVRAANSNGNTFLGLSSGQYSQTSSAFYNTAVGTSALSTLTTGQSNTALGYQALQGNTLGSYNVALSSNALLKNKTGSSNVAIGDSSQFNNLSGVANIAIGQSSLFTNTVGNYNVAIGNGALNSATNTSNNVAIGNGALSGMSSGNGYMTAVGYNAGGNITSSNGGNSFLGYQAGGGTVGGFPTLSNVEYSTAIGYNAQVQSHNSLVLGQVGVKVGIGTTMPGNILSVSPLYNSGTASQSGNIVTGSSTNWTSDVIGKQFIFSDGTGGGTVIGYTNATTLTVSKNVTVSSQAFRIHTIGLQATDAGTMYIQNSSSSLVQYKNAAGVAFMNADSTNGQISVGESSQSLKSLPVTLSRAYGGRFDVGDVNNDGKQDIVSSIYGSSFATSAYLGNGNGTFGSETLTTQFDGSGTTLCDVNGDGKLDIIMYSGSGGTNQFVVKTGVGNGLFNPGVTSTLAASYVINGFACADVNNDGKPDVIVTAAFSSTYRVEVSLNTGTSPYFGTGTETDYPALPGFPANYPVVGDVNGDGYQDIAVNLGNTIGVYLNQLNGTFGTRNDYTVGVFGTQQNGGLVLADVNGDGKKDIIRTEWINRGFAVAINSGTGTFPSYNEYDITNIAARQPGEVAVADMNGDNLPDVVFGYNDNGASDTRLKIAYNNGNGTFNNANIISIPSASAPGNLIVKDFTGDGKPDILYTDLNSQQLTLIQNQTINNVSALVVGSKSGAVGEIIKVATDGSDALRINDVSGQVMATIDGTGTLTLGKQKANFTQAQYSAAYSNYTNGVVSADFNNDGKLDVASITGSGTTMSVSLNNGAGGYGTATGYATTNQMNGIVAADVNNDGYVDIVTVSSSNNEIRVFINSGTGTFSGGGVSYASTGTAPNKIAIADINKDGRPDVIVSNSTSNNYTVFQNSGTGTFSTTSTVSSGALTAPSGVILSDINNDGYPDLIFTTSGSTAVSAMKNNAGGGYTFGAKSDYTTGAGPTAVAAADVNNDGKVDLAVSNGTANSVSILLNSGTGAFGAKTDYAVAAAPSVIAFADFNNDNKPDIVELSNTNSLHSVLLNSGTGTFANRIDLSTPGSNAQSNIAFTDLNRDGYTDIVAGIGSFAQFYVFTNQMNATVTSTGLANNSIVVNGQGYFQTTTDTTAALQVQNSTGTNIFNVDTTNQRVGILNSAPSYALHVGSATVTSGTTVARFQNAGGTCDITPNIAGGITCTSDLRFKKNITDYSGALAKLSSLRTVNYNLNSEADGSQMHVGFIAQELEAILPDLVLTDADGYKSVSYAGLTPYLVAALQEQQTQISALQSSVGLINGGTINGSLNVTGAVTLGGGLSVTGDVSITGNLTVIDLIAENITINGHVITGGSVPAVTSGTATGTGATATIEGNDTSGKITVVAGTSTTAGELAKVNFNKPFSAKPRIVIAPANSDAAGLNAFYDDSATTTDSFAVWAKNNLEAGKTYIFTYWANQ